MYNILVITIISLFTISCSDNNEGDKAIGKVVSKKSQTNIKENISTEVIQEEPDTKWDRVVGPQETDQMKDSTVTEATPHPSKINYVPTFMVSKNDIVLGNVDAKVVLVEYFSPTCPHCAYYHKVIFPQLKEKYIDTHKIAYVIREFIGNKQDLDAAILARCKNNTDSFLKFQNVILEQQEKWAANSKYRDLLTNMGQIGGVSPEAYAKCLNSNEIIETLLSNTNFVGKTGGFVGTPAFFVNGLQVKGGYGLETISKFIDHALEQNVTK